jgi:hypothetical protein
LIDLRWTMISQNRCQTRISGIQYPPEHLPMGTLGDDALSALLSCPMINELDKLDVSENFISDEFIAEKLPQFELKCELITKGQRQTYPDYDDYGNEINEREYRYCLVGE